MRWGERRIGWRTIAATALAALLVLSWVGSLLIGGDDTDDTDSEGSVFSTPYRSNDGAATSPPATSPGETPAVWVPPNTADPEEMAQAFAAAIWSYDSRVNTYDDWRLAVTNFTDPNGPPASGEVARSMLPLWPQWEQLAQQNGHASVHNVRVSTPTEMTALADDPRTPPGWHGFVVEADQTVTANGQTYPSQRRASVSVVCRPRCWLWSTTYEGPW